MTQTKDFAFSLFHLFFSFLLPKQQFDSVLSYFHPAMVCIVFRKKKHFFLIKQTTDKQQFVSRIEFNKHWEAVN